MAETARLQLPLLSPSQAQKHVTVNEALTRLDALARLRVASSLTTVPVNPGDGMCYLIAPGAAGVWLGRDNSIAIRSNGGWTYAAAQKGWTAWNISLSRSLVFNGYEWLAETQVFSTGGAATIARIMEFDHAIAAGAVSNTTMVIPSHAQVLAVTARVVAAVTGPGLTSLSIGVAADAARYGSGIGIGLNSYSNGITGSPVTYYSDTSLVLTPSGGTFAGGTIRFGVHIVEVTPPRSA